MSLFWSSAVISTSGHSYLALATSRPDPPCQFGLREKEKRMEEEEKEETDTGGRNCLNKSSRLQSTGNTGVLPVRPTTLSTQGPRRPGWKETRHGCPLLLSQTGHFGGVLLCVRPMLITLPYI